MSGRSESGWSARGTGAAAFVGLVALSSFACSGPSKSVAGPVVAPNSTSRSATSVTPSGFCDDLRRLHDLNGQSPQTPGQAQALFEQLGPLAQRLVTDAPADQRSPVAAEAQSIEAVARVLQKYGWDIDRALGAATGSDKAALDAAGNPNDPNVVALDSYGATHCGIQAPPPTVPYATVSPTLGK